MLDFDNKCVGQGATVRKNPRNFYIMKLIFLWKHKQALWGRKKMVHDNRSSSFCSSCVVLNIEKISIYCLLLSWWCTLSSPSSLLWEEKYQKIAWLGMGRWNLPSWWGKVYFGWDIFPCVRGVIWKFLLLRWSSAGGGWGWASYQNCKKAGGGLGRISSYRVCCWE